MITITNLKVGGFDPRWASFRGFSLLFDNPENSLTHLQKGIKQLSVDPNQPKLSLYKKLSEALDQIGRDFLINTYLFCPLPLQSYHVTVWDGGNNANLYFVQQKHRRSFEDFMQRLPESIANATPFTTMITQSSLVNQTWNLEFEFDQLEIWGNEALVAKLLPYNSSNDLERLKKERDSLTNDFYKQFGIKPVDKYTPHVSLGYFANKELAQLATCYLKKWNEVIYKSVYGQTIAFNSISLYGFMDMATFFRNDRLNSGGH
jgi:hypothetical protein